jgi:hypothetical protein
MRKLVLASGVLLGGLLSANSLQIASPPDGATVHSAFVALEATAASGACFGITVDAGRASRACADSSGHLQAVLRVGPGSHALRICGDHDAPAAARELHITANPPAAPTRTGAPWELLRVGDVVLSASADSVQRTLYDARYTHSAMYLGPGSDGAALLAEAVNEEAAAGLDTIRAVPIEQSLVWRADTADIFRLKDGLAPAERAAFVAFLRGVVNRGLKFRSTAEEFSALYNAWLQWDAKHDRPVQEARFQAALDRLHAHKSSLEKFNCTTLVWRAYQEASKGRIDLGDPNRMQFTGRLAGGFTPAFLERLRPYLLGPDAFYLSGRLEKVTAAK